jgi:hypothetical protein
MEMEVDDAVDALVPVDCDQALERMGWVEQPVPGQLSDIRRQCAPIEVEVALPELVPALAITRVQQGGC